MPKRDPVTPVLMVAGLAGYITLAVLIHLGRWTSYQATQKTR